MTTEQTAAVARRPRRTRKIDPDIRALAQFARALEGMEASSRYAAIAWLADRFLGIKRLPWVR